MEADAYILGVSHQDFWDLPPYLTIQICEKYIEQHKRESEEDMSMAWYQSYLNTIGAHDPKKFPKQPGVGEKTESNKPMDDDIQAGNLLALKNRFKSKSGS